MNKNDLITQFKQEYDCDREKKYIIILYKLKITFIINTKEILIFVSIFLNDSVDVIINTIKNRLNMCNNIQCDICCNEYRNYLCSKIRITNSQCNFIILYWLFLKLCNKWVRHYDLLIL